MQVRPLAGGDQPVHHALDLRLELGVVVGAAIGGDETLMLPALRRGERLFRVRGGGVGAVALVWNR